MLYILQGVSKKRYFLDFRLIYVLDTGFNFFACDFELKFRALPLRHSNYIHPESKLPLNIVIKYMEVCKDATAQASHLKAGIKSMFAHVLSAFLEQFGFWVDVILATSWNGIEILILKHMWKVKSDFLSRNKKEWQKYLFLETPCSKNSPINFIVIIWIWSILIDNYIGYVFILHFVMNHSGRRSFC